MNFFKKVRDEARRKKELIERKEVYYSDIKNKIIEYIDMDQVEQNIVICQWWADQSSIICKANNWSARDSDKSRYFVACVASVSARGRREKLGRALFLLPF